MFLVLEFTIGEAFSGLALISPDLRHVFARSYGYCFQSLTYHAGTLLTAVYFARTETWNTFLNAFQLRSAKWDPVWAGLVFMLCLQGVAHELVSHGLSHPARASSELAFLHHSGAARFLYLVPALLFAPLCEETSLRGFVFPALRSSYSFELSTAIILAWTAITHYTQFATSGAAVLCLSLFAAALCWLREKSGSTLPCIVAHFVFNLSGLSL
jgi:membrane protease YdiL (CAAX protease family)